MVNQVIFHTSCAWLSCVLYTFMRMGKTKPKQRQQQQQNKIKKEETSTAIDFNQIASFEMFGSLVSLYPSVLISTDLYNKNHQSLQYKMLHVDHLLPL